MHSENVTRERIRSLDYRRQFGTDDYYLVKSKDGKIELFQYDWNINIVKSESGLGKERNESRLEIGTGKRIG